MTGLIADELCLACEADAGTEHYPSCPYFERYFVQTVRRMRNAQKSYFKTRSSFDLTVARELEQEVDGLLSKME